MACCGSCSNWTAKPSSASVPELGYLHRGYEKIAENGTYHEFIPHTDRLDYLSPISNNVGVRPGRRETARHRSPAPGAVHSRPRERDVTDRLAPCRGREHGDGRRRADRAPLDVPRAGEDAGYLRRAVRSPVHDELRAHRRAPAGLDAAVHGDAAAVPRRVRSRPARSREAPEHEQDLHRPVRGRRAYFARGCNRLGSDRARCSAPPACRATCAATSRISSIPNSTSTSSR